MAANDFAAQNGTEKLSTNALTTVNGTTVTTDLIEVQRVKVGFGSDGALRDVDAANGMPVVVGSNGVISTSNSSSVALGINGVFTGAWEDVTEYTDIRVVVFADQVSATDGLQIQQSSNGINADILDFYSIPVSTGKNFSVGASGKFFRIVYTNGSVAQTVLRLQSKLSKSYSKSSSVRPQDARTNDNDYEEVLSHLMGYDPTALNWNRLRATIANGLAVDITRSALPTGAATETTLVGVRTDLGTDGTTPPTVLGAGTGVRGWLRSIYEKLTGTLTVTGTFWQATQPVSLATLATVTTVGAVTAITNALPTGANSIGTIQQAALTKGTQGTTGVTTQDLKDAGRARVSVTFQASAPAVADTLLSLVKVTNGAAAAGATSIGVAAGKILRITSITLSIKANAAAAAFATLTFRQNPAGATVIGSVSECRMDVGNTAAVAGAADKVEVIFPDGMEFSGAQTFGCSLAAQAITNIISISINGFEY